MESKRKMAVSKVMGVMIGGVVVAVVLLGLLKYRNISVAMAAGASMAPPPTAVTSVVAEETNWNVSIDVVGSLEATQGVTVSAEEKGQVEKIGFESGSVVKQGDLLVQLDTSVEEAQLKSAEAKLQLARLNHKRAEMLKAGRAMAESAVDEAISTLRQAEADVASTRAVIAKKTMTAPFSGRAGIRMVNLGQYVPEGAPIVPLYAYDPIFANFALPQQYLRQITVGQKVRLVIDAFPNEMFEGAVTALDPQVDPSTRNVRVQATLVNPEERLRPGMFAQVKLLLAADERHITIPSSAINFAPYGNSVYIIETKKVPGRDGKEVKEFLGVTQRFVKLGATRGDQVAVLDGLKAGEQIVSSGLFRLRPDAPVQVNNSIVPGNNPAPKPADT